jgi:hypothetical protein
MTFDIFPKDTNCPMGAVESMKDEIGDMLGLSANPTLAFLTKTRHGSF